MDVLLTEIEPPSAVMRAGVSQEGMIDLIRSIKEEGLINPIVVRKKGDKYELITGYRRVLAHERLGLDKISARVIHADDLKAELIKMAENREREDVNALDEGVYFREVMRLQGWNQKELAEASRYSQAYVSQRIASSEWPEMLRDAIIDEKINFSVAREFAGVKDEAMMERLVLQAVISGVTPAVAAKWKNEANRVEVPKQGPEDEGNGVQGAVEGEGAMITCHTCGSETSPGHLATFVVCENCGHRIRAAVKEGVFTEKEGK